MSAGPAGSSSLAEGVTRAGLGLRLGAEPSMPADLGQTSSFQAEASTQEEDGRGEGLPSLLGKWGEENWKPFSSFPSAGWLPATPVFWNHSLARVP